MSQAFCLSPVVNMLPRKGTLLTERAPYSPEKGTTEADHKRAESSHILQAMRHQATCEARIGMGQDIPFPHLGRSDHVQTPQQSIVNRCQLQICYTPNCSAALLWKKFTVVNKNQTLVEYQGQGPMTSCLSINRLGEGLKKTRD